MDSNDVVKIAKDGLYRMGDKDDRTGSQFQYFAGDTVAKAIHDRLKYIGPIPDKTIDRITAVKAEPAPSNKSGA